MSTYPAPRIVNAAVFDKRDFGLIHPPYPTQLTTIMPKIQTRRPPDPNDYFSANESGLITILTFLNS